MIFNIIKIAFSKGGLGAASDIKRNKKMALRIFI
jgi:hypothetical protein